MKLVKIQLVFGIMMALIVLFAFGCTRKHVPVAMPKETAAMQNKMPSPELYASLPPSEGSLWTDSSNMLFVDQKARRVGDTIIVDIIENSSSKLDANTKTSKESTLSSKIPNFMGYMAWLKSKNPLFDPENMLDAEYTHEFEGSGEIDRSGQITASIGAIVTNVLPNGNITIFGRREMKVNHETQYITVSGIIRPKDIGSDNRVKSTYLADARIEYSGKGVIAEKQRVGWLTRALDYVWPF